jgi:hypothetical protein
VSRESPAEFADIDGLRPLVQARGAVLIGHRDHAERRRSGAPDPANHLRLALPFEEVRRRGDDRGRGEAHRASDEIVKGAHYFRSSNFVCLLHSKGSSSLGVEGSRRQVAGVDLPCLQGYTSDIRGGCTDEDKGPEVG